MENPGESKRVTRIEEDRSLYKVTVVRFSYSKYFESITRARFTEYANRGKKSRAVRSRYGRIGKRCGKERHSRVTDTGRWQQTALSGIDRSVVDASPRLPARSEVIRSISVALCLV